MTLLGMKTHTHTFIPSTRKTAQRLFQTIRSTMEYGLASNCTNLRRSTVEKSGSLSKKQPLPALSTTEFSTTDFLFTRGALPVGRSSNRTLYTCFILLCLVVWLTSYSLTLLKSTWYEFLWRRHACFMLLIWLSNGCTLSSLQNAHTHTCHFQSFFWRGR